jgi:hypothetical protein
MNGFRITSYVLRRVGVKAVTRFESCKRTLRATVLAHIHTHAHTHTHTRAHTHAHAHTHARTHTHTHTHTQTNKLTLGTQIGQTARNQNWQPTRAHRLSTQQLLHHPRCHVQQLRLLHLCRSSSHQHLLWTLSSHAATCCAHLTCLPRYFCSHQSFLLDVCSHLCRCLCASRDRLRSCL